MGFERLRKITTPTCLVILLVLIAKANSQTTLVLNTANDSPNATDDHKGIGDRFLTEAFRRMGVLLQIVRLPSERALVNANEGTDDGNFARVEGIDKIYPNLVRVPEEITKFEFMAFSRKPAFKIEGWDSLKPYNVGIITGWKILEKNVTGTKSLTKVSDAEILFGLLAKDRIDIAVYDRRQGLLVLHKENMADAFILEPPLAVNSMYLYLNKKHSDLVPKLTEALRAMKKDGTYQNIVDEVLRTFSLK